MPHACTTLVIRCMDFRFISAINEYLESKDLMNHCDIVAAAGAAKNFASPEHELDREFLMRQIDIAKRLHGISEVIIINHTDCGAYGGKSAFASKDKEWKKHSGELAVAAQMIKERYPSLAVQTLIADIENSGEIEIKSI
jgi:carbonic anhydrase